MAIDFSYHTVRRLENRDDAGAIAYDRLVRDSAKYSIMVAYGPIQPSSPPDWRWSRKGDHVTIPLFSYVLPYNPAEVFGAGVQRAVSALAGVDIKKVIRIHLSLCDEVHTLVSDYDGQEFYELAFGMAITLRE